MKNKELFKSGRWHEDVGAELVRHEKSTEDERNKNKEEFKKILRKRRIIK